MKKRSLYLIITILFSACSEEQQSKKVNSGNIKQTANPEKKTELDQRELIDILNDSLKNVVNLSHFLDSITYQKNVHLISQLKEEWNEKENCFYYFNSSYKFKLKQETRIKDGEEYVNATFYDGKTKIDFADYTILQYKDDEFETDDFAFNFYNSLFNCRIIQIGSLKFLYAEISFMCNGIGCNSQINMIYDLQTRIPVFTENYRFPYSNYLISDFDNNKLPDLLIVTRSKFYQMKGFPLQEAGFKILWYEYVNGKFKIKTDVNHEALFCQFYGITKDFDHEMVKHFSLVKQHWN